MTKYQLLLDRIHEVQDLRKAIRVLTWDREVNMPQGGVEDRTNQITTLKRLCHSIYTSDEMGELIEGAAEELNGAEYSSSEASLVRFLRRDYRESRMLPEKFVARSALINGKATAAWKKAREKEDFSLFTPWLNEVVEVPGLKGCVLPIVGETQQLLRYRIQLGILTELQDRGHGKDGRSGAPPTDTQPQELCRILTNAAGVTHAAVDAEAERS